MPLDLNVEPPDDLIDDLGCDDYDPTQPQVQDVQENHIDAEIEQEGEHMADDEFVFLVGVDDYMDPDNAVYADEVDVVLEQDELFDIDTENDPHSEANEPTQRKNTTETQRNAIYAALLQISTNGKLKKNSTRIVAEMFNVSMDTVRRIWQRGKDCHAEGIPVDIKSKKAKNCGRKKIEVDLSYVSSIPLHKRGTIRSLSQALGVNKTTLHRLFKQGLLRRHSNSLKPLLKPANKKERLRWCLRMLDPDTLPNDPKFIDMAYIIHMDEKWFNATKKDRNFYMHPGEEDPYRIVQNKNAIDKVMFLSAVARPRFDDEGNCIFDGKLGVWAFVRKEPAKRKSGNRARGTIITKTMKVDRNTIRSYMISKLLPAIVAKWPPQDAGKTIWIQQDNARTHVPCDDPQFRAAVAQTGLDIQIISQPPNSPDMNALDLGLFASLQSLTAARVSRNMDELIDNVEKEFNDYNPLLLNRVFLTLQGCLIEVMKDDGGNKYKVPHMSKEKLEALGILPKRLSCDRQLYEKVMEALQL